VEFVSFAAGGKKKEKKKGEKQKRHCKLQITN